MIRTSTITPEVIDVDVCYGDYDGSYTKTIYVLDLMPDDHYPMEAGTTMYIKAEHDAKMMARMWELGMTHRGEYGEIVFDKIFDDEVMALMLDTL